MYIFKSDAFVHGHLRELRSPALVPGLLSLDSPQAILHSAKQTDTKMYVFKTFLLSGNVAEAGMTLAAQPGRSRRRTVAFALALALSLACDVDPAAAQPVPDRPAQAPPKLTFIPLPQGGAPAGGLDPECGTMRYFGDALAAGMEAQFDAIYYVADALLPDLGVAYDTHLGGGPVLAWPWVIPFGPERGRVVRHERCAERIIPGLQAHRLVPEIGVSFESPTRGWLRLGYTFVWHREGSKIGLMLGAGPTLTFGAARAVGSLGPELGLRFGACCSPRYSMLVLRYDEHLLNGNGRAFMLKVGLAYW